MGRSIRYLTDADVRAAMPPVAERLALAERTMTALVADAELPAKIGVHPRPTGAFAHAMPALLRGPEADGAGDRLGLKWVAGVPANSAAGLPVIHALIVLSDARTGEPRAILDGGAITAERTAAVSGVVIARFGTGARRVAMIGAGVQGRSHLEVLAQTLPGVQVTIHDRHPERATALAATAAAMPAIGGADVAADARDATSAADVVITAVTFTDPARRQPMTGAWLREDALVIPVDYATMCAADVARDAARFLVDDRAQFLANREAGQFDGYPDPGMTIGEALLAGTTRPTGGRVVATHLGVGLADVVFADAIVARAEALGLGVDLPR